jgi:hypothetical protein
MTARHDLDRMLDAFLMDGPLELPDPSFDTVRDRMETTRQRVVMGPWRVPDMSKLVPIGLGVAALVVAVVVGARLLGPAPSGPGAVPTVAPTITPEPTASSPLPSSSTSGASPSAAAGLPLGTFELWRSGSPVSVTIAGPGWVGIEGQGFIEKGVNGADGPAGAGMIVFPDGDGWYVPADPCKWTTTWPQARSDTVDELVAALAAQATRNPSVPSDITLDGHEGKSITLHVPDDAAFASCDAGRFCTLGDPVRSSTDSCDRYAQGPGQIDEMWIVDVEGRPVVVDWAYYAGTPPEDVAELRAIVESMTFE